jgi:hypothetical protein
MAAVDCRQRLQDVMADFSRRQDEISEAHRRAEALRDRAARRSHA